MLCNSCEVLFINGIKTHELGCPEAFRDYRKECKECGQDFQPDFREQEHCSQSCYQMYLGISTEYNEDGEEYEAF
jgi:hypothetical protein